MSTAMKTMKAKTKKPARKKTPARKAKPKPKASPEASLKTRLEAEFAQAVWNAKAYVSDPPRLRALFEDASKQTMSLPKEPFRHEWPYLHAMLRLIRAYQRGEYRVVSEATLVVIIAAIIYVISPLDVIPDSIPGIGYLDDATVLTLALKRTRNDLDEFMMWEITNP
jgi:uncharacterized membrane protein YkvA (DUF1232 family)